MVPLKTTKSSPVGITKARSRRPFGVLALGTGKRIIFKFESSTLEKLLKLRKQREALQHELRRLEDTIRKVLTTGSPPTHRRRKSMDLATFYAGLQAIAAFLQVWQTEQDRKLAVEAYYREKKQALAAPEIQNRAAEANNILKRYPRFEKMFGNRIGRCEDDFEAKLRDARDEELVNAAEQFNKCKCIIMQAMRKVSGGELDGTYKDDWEKLQCDILLSAN
jgi:hypothetical protein